jgi:hypothetical protein
VRGEGEWVEGSRRLSEGRRRLGGVEQVRGEVEWVEGTWRVR